MTPLYADFNARTEDDRVRLSTAGSKRSLVGTDVGPGAWVWVSDGEVRAGARIEERDGELLAKVAWETVEDVLPDDEAVSPEEVTRALRDLQAQMQRADRDNRRVLQLLPIAARALQPGRPDYFRSRVAQAFGYPDLALLAIEDALTKAPGTPGFVHLRLDLMRNVDLEAAVREATALAADPEAPAVVLLACAGVFSASAQHLDENEARERHRELIALTDRFETASGREIVPSQATSLVYVARGFALLHLGDRDGAISAFERAIANDPASAEAFAARGLETYPAEAAIRDLERALELGMSSFWPAYYLAHHSTYAHDWAHAEGFARMALRLQPPSRVRANLLEWMAIARFQQGGDLEDARQELRRALDLAPNNDHLRRNLSALDRLRGPTPPSDVRWEVMRDAEKRTVDVQAAA